MTKPLTAGQLRVAPAIAARKRLAQERLADRLRAAGWTCTPPEQDQGDDQCATAGQPQA